MLSLTGAARFVTGPSHEATVKIHEGLAQVVAIADDFGEFSILGELVNLPQF
jgi:hypothetical protein